MTRGGRWFRSAIKLLGLSGADGDLSYSKVLTIIVVCLSARGHLDPTVAVVAIAAGFGRVFLQHALDKLQMNIASAFTRTSIEQKTTIDETVTIRRDPDLGIEEN